MHKFLRRFKEKDAFLGYQKDVAAAVVFQASSQLRKTCDRLREPVTGSHHLWESAWKQRLLGNGPLEEVACQREGSDPWKRAVCYIIIQYSIWMSACLHQKRMHIYTFTQQLKH